MKFLNQIIPLAIILFTLVTYNFMNAAWTPAPGTPTAGNAAAPVTVDTMSQVKLGALGTGALSITGDAQLTDADPTIRFEDTSGSSYWIHNNAGRFYILGDKDDNGSWDATPFPLVISASTTGDYAQFADQVRANEYCDRNGNNCRGSGGLQVSSLNNCPIVTAGVERTCDISGTWDFCAITNVGGFEDNEMEGFRCQVGRSGGDWQITSWGLDVDWVRCGAICIRG